MFISQQVDSLTEAERYFNPLYLIVQKGKEHLKQQLVRGSVCDCDTTLPNRRIGIFSVAADRYVTFSQGNLQYFPAAKLWKFADNQYDILGNANKYLSPTFRNWVDLFGYSANNTTAPFGISTSTNNADYTGDFVDWGNNWICGDKPNTWRTLSHDEWKYLTEKRDNAKQLRGVACVNGVNGLILLPDDWITPAGIPFTSGTHVSDGGQYFALVNDYTLEQWQRMEEVGAVFLPAAGVVKINEELRADSRASYWSATGQGAKAYILNFHSNFIITSPQDNYGHRSVRLVHDTILLEYTYQSININGVKINMIPVKGGTFTMGSGKEQHQVTLSDYYIAQSELTQALWKAVMGTNPSNVKGDNLPVECVSWHDCQLFIQKLNDLTGLHFRLPTEAEWEYAAQGGQKSKGYTYAGSNDIDEVAWYTSNSENKLHAVGEKLPNELGIYDMTGNVWEWCADTFDNSSEGHKEAVLRGGAYDNRAATCKLTTSRTTRKITYITPFAGFRLLLED